MGELNPGIQIEVLWGRGFHCAPGDPECSIKAATNKGHSGHSWLGHWLLDPKPKWSARTRSPGRNDAWPGDVHLVSIMDSIRVTFPAFWNLRNKFSK